MNENIKAMLDKVRADLTEACPGVRVDDVLYCDREYAWSDVIGEVAENSVDGETQYSKVLHWMADNRTAVQEVFDGFGWEGNTVQDVVEPGRFAQELNARGTLFDNLDVIAFGVALVHLLDVEFDCSDLTGGQIETLRRYTGTPDSDDWIEETMAAAEDWYNNRDWTGGDAATE